MAEQSHTRRPRIAAETPLKSPARLVMLVVSAEFKSIAEAKTKEVLRHTTISGRSTISDRRHLIG